MIKKHIFNTIIEILIILIYYTKITIHTEGKNMKNFIYIISIFVLIVSIISCGGGNKKREQTENTQTNQTETNKVYVNPTTTNENHNTDIDI